MPKTTAPPLRMRVARAIAPEAWATVGAGSISDERSLLAIASISAAERVITMLALEGMLSDKARVEWIKAAAIKLSDSSVVTLPPPARHHNILRHMADRSWPHFNSFQGFVTNLGRFVDREEACVLAREAGQIKVKTGPADKLFSEDLW